MLVYIKQRYNIATVNFFNEMQLHTHIRACNLITPTYV